MFFFTEDKETMRAKREEAIAKTQTRTQEAIKLREEAKRENEKAAVREMMKVVYDSNSLKVYS